MHPLPLPGSPGAPSTFNGSNVTPFLRKYESMCDNYKAPSDWKEYRNTVKTTSYGGWKDSPRGRTRTRDDHEVTGLDLADV